MPWLRKETGHCTVMGYEWPYDGAVVEVTSAHAAILLGIVGGGYTEVEPPRHFSEVVVEKPDTRTEYRGRKNPVRRIITE